MKFAKISGKIALIALAACCLLAAPALCLPMDGGPGLQGQRVMFAPMNNLTAEEIGNMTVNQIKALSDKKKAELENMTLAEIKLLSDKKVQERNNMTLNQFKEENENMRQMARILEGLGFGRHIKA